ncbi:MAG: methyltransferase domain-containing protein [Acidobacteria bacterium]|nr:methyltransferase domain-containing protein [Acidobacteriota bacterium]
MNPQIAKWNARYADREPGALPEPSPPLPDAVAGVPPGRALDLACGAGRHAVWLGSRGWRVAAVDGSDAAVALLLANAERAGCRERIAPHVADLEADPPEFTIEPAAYDLIVDCYFLHRPLFAAIRGGVRPGGLFVAALHLPAPDGQRGHGYVLRPGELERMVRGWRWNVLHAAERTARVAAGGEPGVAEIVARRPDVRPPSHS